MTSCPRRRFACLVAATMLMPPLAGCGLLSGEPNRQSYLLVPKVAFPAGLPQVAAQLVVATPSAPSALDRRRIALIRPPASLDYFADALWSDRVPFLVQAALVDGFERSGAVAAVATEGLGLHADFVLETTISDFAAIYDSPNGAPQISVGIDARLISQSDRRIVAHTVVSRHARAAANALPEIVAAFDVALGQAVEEVVTWTLTNPALSPRAGSVKSRPPFVHPDRGGTR